MTPLPEASTYLQAFEFALMIEAVVGCDRRAIRLVEYALEVGSSSDGASGGPLLRRVFIEEATID